MAIKFLKRELEYKKYSVKNHIYVYAGLNSDLVISVFSNFRDSLWNQVVSRGFRLERYLKDAFSK